MESFQRFINHHVDGGNDQAIAEVILPPRRCHGRDAANDDLFGAAGAVRQRYLWLRRRDRRRQCKTEKSPHRSAKAARNLT